MKKIETNQKKGPDAPQASENTEEEDNASVGMTESESNDGGSVSDATNGEVYAFLGSRRVLRSPVLNQAATSSQQSGITGEETPKAGASSAPNFIGGTSQGGVQLGKTALQEVRRRVNELFDFIKDKNNVHTKIKQMVTGVKAAMNAAEREHTALKTRQTSLTARAEGAEKALQAKLEEVAQRKAPPQTPTGPRPKRDRETPGEEEDAKKQKQGNGANPEPAKEEGWETARKRKRKKKRGRTGTPKSRRFAGSATKAMLWWSR